MSRRSSILAVFSTYFADLLLVELLHAVNLRPMVVPQLQNGLIHLANLVLQSIRRVFILRLF